MKRIGMLVFSTVILFVTFQGCGTGENAPKAKAEEPAKVEGKVVGEAALTTIKLVPEAEQRLGIKTAEAAYRDTRSFYPVAGEVIVPPGQVFVIDAPVAGSIALGDGGLPRIGGRVKAGQILFRIVPLLPVERDLRIKGEADVATAATRLEAAKARAERAALLLRDGVGSVRAREDADEAVRLAETELAAARSVLEQIDGTPVSADVTVAINTPQPGILMQVHIAEGQMVSAGTPLYEVAQLDPVWIRTPVYSGDVRSLEQKSSAIVRPINAEPSDKGQVATPVTAPPSADPLAGTTDLFYRLANPNLALRPGELVRVSVPRQGEEECLQIPYQAILYDINGGTWVYEKTEPYTFVRRRVSVESISGEEACLSEGLETGTAVVTDGVAELFGTEFGAGK